MGVRPLPDTTAAAPLGPSAAAGRPSTAARAASRHTSTAANAGIGRPPLLRGSARTGSPLHLITATLTIAITRYRCPTSLLVSCSHESFMVARLAGLKPPVST